MLGVAGGPDRADAFTLRDIVVLTDQDRAQMEERDGVAVGCPDRHCLSVRRQPTREGNASVGRCEDLGTRVAADVDARMAVLSVLRPAKVEPAQHTPVGGPGPRRCLCRRDQPESERENDRCQLRQHRRATVAGGSVVVKDDYSERR
jgi:hypothetical protein